VTFYYFSKDGKLNVELAYPLKLMQNGTKSGLTVNPMFSTLETRIRPGLDEESYRLIKLGGGLVDNVSHLVSLNSPLKAA